MNQALFEKFFVEEDGEVTGELVVMTTDVVDGPLVRE